ncbi:hypothetical protein Vretimale_2616 [Volvox reticuliferus]|uniref:Uncharacterized protein n=1 Tax=Volvox reticuliferus TaxID=1737510 RepID=A0A8J4FED5_9CHLO|nr:hypothetical protein Vretifemale_2050 [Volvox reticuliferus]GIL96905.1 hypothetical protein Vretimale_2616 [Volvox reticuliferus]
MRRPLGVVAALAMALIGLASARGLPVEGPADACQACLISVRILEDFLCDPAATDFLVDFVEKQICPHMGNKAQCHNLAEGLLPTVVQWIRASATPASLCSSAGVCGAALLQVPSLNKPALRVRDTTECAMCKFVVRTVQMQLENSQVMEEVKTIALQICGDLPDELAEGCTDFVNNYASMITELVEEIDPETLCGLIGSCVEAFKASPPPPIPAALMQALAGSQLLRQPPPPPVFSVILGLPLPMFGPQGGPNMMGIMAHGGPGMGMRPEDQGSVGDTDQEQNQHSSKPWMPMMHNGPDQFANDACDYCKMAVAEAHALVSNPQVQAEVRNYTKAVCDNFQAFSEMCKAYVDMYSPLVFTLLEEYLVPETVCAETGLCPPPSSHPRSWKCWLLDGWLGDVLMKLGLGGLLPHHERNHGQDAVHEMKDEPRMSVQ